MFQVKNIHLYFQWLIFNPGHFGDLCPNVTLQLVLRTWVRSGPQGCRGSGGREGVAVAAGNFISCLHFRCQYIVKLCLTISHVSSQ